MVVFESWIIIVIDEFLSIIFTYSSFISGDINLERVIFFQNLTTWVKCTLAIIYNQFSKTAYNQQNMVFESWIRMVIDEVLRLCQE